MLKIMLTFMLIFFSFIMFFLSHPFSMGLMILFQTLLTCLISGLLINSYWFSYILFLIFLGGILILFMYTISIASNEMFKFSFNLMFFFSIFFIIFIIFMMYFFNKLNWLNFSFNYEMINFFEKYIFFNNENKMSLSKLYNQQTYIFMMMMIIYLFITLIAIVKITNMFFGPLRIFN